MHLSKQDAIDSLSLWGETMCREFESQGDREVLDETGILFQDNNSGFLFIKHGEPSNRSREEEQ